jgi:sulfite reductase (NADPH) flavoprotein alpha-component
MLRKVLFRLHFLAGLTAGTVLALVGATGAMMAFEDEIIDWLNRDVRTVATRASDPLTPGALQARVAEQYPERALLNLRVANDPTAAVRVTLAPPRRARSADGEGEGEGQGQAQQRRERGETRYLDPYTGEALAATGTRGESFFRATRALHRYLIVAGFGSQSVGRQITGACAMTCVLLALSGLYLRWPRRLFAWRTWLLLDFRRSGRALLWNLHAVAGTWVLLVYLVNSLTGLQWSYEWYKRGMFALAGVEMPERERSEQPRRERAEGERAGGENRETAAGGERGGRRGAGEEGGRPPVRANLTVAWDAFRDATREDGFRSATLTLPRAAGRPLEIRYLDREPAHDRAVSTLVLDAESGRVIRHDRYAEKTLGGKLVSSVFALHTGSFFGVGGQIVFGLAAAAMPMFAVTGWMMWLSRRRAQTRRRLRTARRDPIAVIPVPADVTAPAAAVSGAAMAVGASRAAQ